MTASSTNNATNLPVIIVGAGPCGLVAAATLQKHGVPFVIVERASRAKICSNAGSGFELAPTAFEILENRLGYDISQIVSYYEAMTILTAEGKKIRYIQLPPGFKRGWTNRAEMQNFLLERIFPHPKDEEGILLCGSGIETYHEEEGRVVATLASTDGGPNQTITGSVLLACDGIHSRCRAVMHGRYDSTTGTTHKNIDPTHYCGALVYWGKTSSPRGSDIDQEFAKTQKASEKDTTTTTSFVFTLTTHKAPAVFVCVPSKDKKTLIWAITVNSKAGRSNRGEDKGSDLTRRGGGVLTEDEKKRLFSIGKGCDKESVFRGIKDFPLIEKLIERTPAEDITEAGLYDRENLDLPYTSEKKLVALLGDSAHPQTPFLGQGANMAITDAYVYATSLAVARATQKKTIPEAVADSDTPVRHQQASQLVQHARFGCNMTTSQNLLTTNLMWLYMKYGSSEAFVNQKIEFDESNRDYLKQLDEGVYSPTQLGDAIS